MTGCLSRSRKCPPPRPRRCWRSDTRHSEGGWVMSESGTSAGVGVAGRRERLCVRLPAGGEELSLRAVRGSERVSDLFSFRLDLEATAPLPLFPQLAAALRGRDVCFGVRQAGGRTRH